MHLQRRHFEFIAATIRDIANLEDRLAVAVAFANACGPTNPNFRRDQFLTACGYTGPDGTPWNATEQRREDRQRNRRERNARLAQLLGRAA